MSKTVIFLLIVLVIAVGAGIVVAGYFWGDQLIEPVDLPPARNDNATGETTTETDPNVEIVAQDLEIPWEMVFLPNGEMLVTQRTGSIKRISENGQVYAVDGVEHVGEGGLLGMALHPDFENNQYLYVYMTTRAGDGLQNRVVRYTYQEDQLQEPQVILEGIPGAIYHDGGRMAFGPDGYLYITTGDARQRDLAQDITSLAGKILRITDDGSIPDDNSFNNEVYSYGHRNPQGLTWDTEGRLWATEHGSNGEDELNLIEKGSNYGWPIITGDESQEGMKTPVAHSGSDTWAPAGIIVGENSIIFAGLRGSRLFEAHLNGTKVSRIDSHFSDQFGRLRAVVIGPDDQIYVSTSNTDGRGEERAGDDKIIKINPEALR